MQTGAGRAAAGARGPGGTFEPVLVPKRSGRVAGGLDDMVISLYAHGMSVRDIIHHLHQVYGTELSPSTVSAITDAVLEEAKAWQSRPLDRFYAVVFLDAIVVKVRDSQVVQNKPGVHRRRRRRRRGEARAGHLAVRHPAGHARPRARAPASGARSMADLRNRGVRDILIACVDGLAGFADAITAAFPQTVVQRCVVHLIRNALRPVACRDAAQVAAELRKIYTAPTAEAAFDALAAFTESAWGKKYPQAARVWEAGLGRLHALPGVQARRCGRCSSPPTASRA